MYIILKNWDEYLKRITYVDIALQLLPLIALTAYSLVIVGARYISPFITIICFGFIFS